ncbi:Probable bifunctional chitinase/lysozyme [Includes: Chitinase [Durusdinium trenchii]|uniref:Probable bifunctional chitinase/lysozyme n=1 Tax=Durusdinium trenchii TaxID=1381693 RepID=A0ABP0MMP1_9DINO
MSLLAQLRKWFSHGSSKKSRHSNPASGLNLESLERRALLAAQALQDAPDVEYQVTQEWSSGQTAELVLCNDEAQPFTNWQLEFELDQPITSVWNAQIEDLGGGRYRITPPSWDTTLDVGESLTIGLSIEGSGSEPTNLAFITPGSEDSTALDELLPDDEALINEVATEAQITDPVSVEFTAPSQWYNGFTGNITITNNGDTTISGWELAFDAEFNIESVWSAKQLSASDGYYVIKNEAWNGTIAPGGSVTFGFTAAAAEPVSPMSFVFNGQTVGEQDPDPDPETNSDPTAAYDSVTTPFETAVIVSVLANDSDPDGDTLSIQSFTQPTSGTVTDNGDGTLTYNPTVGFSGGDSFNYTVADGRGGTAVGVVNLTVSPADPDVPGEVIEAVVWPDRFFAPYVDATNWPLFDVVASAQETGVLFYNLGFVVAGSQNQASWGTYYDVADGFRQAEIEQLREMGGDVMVSFGGAANTELAVAITDVDQLTDTYQAVIDQYSLTHIDFDIEGAWVADRTSIDRRSEAIARLQANPANENLQVWFTLPVLPTGLTSDGLYVIESALNHGVDIAGVNIMAMDYGDGAAPNPDGRMGDYAIQAAESLFAQLRTLYDNAGVAKSDTELWGMVGVTPMIGINDVQSEVFDQQEARELLAFAQQQDIGMLSFWSTLRDRSGDIGQLSSFGSGIVQEPGEFSSIFQVFTEDGTPKLSISDANVVESDSGQTVVELTITLSKPLDTPLSVGYATEDGTAPAASGDYQASSGTVVFAAGQTQQTVTLVVNGDLEAEATESFVVRLQENATAGLADATGVVTVTDNDSPPVLTVADATVVEGGEGEFAVLRFMVSLSRAVKNGETVSFDFETVPNTALAGEDYVHATGTVVFAAGETTRYVDIVIPGDVDEELDEMMFLDITQATGATLTSSRATGTIADDDTPAASYAFQVESDWGSGFTGAMQLANTTGQTISGWTLTFEADFEITSIWNAVIISHVGNQYVIGPAEWNRNIPPAGTIDFGFVAMPGGPNEPTGVQLLPTSVV